MDDVFCHQDVLLFYDVSFLIYLFHVFYVCLFYYDQAIDPHDEIFHHLLHHQLGQHPDDVYRPHHHEVRFLCFHDLSYAVDHHWHHLYIKKKLIIYKIDEKKILRRINAKINVKARI
jgi:hypothetical protein